MINRLQRFIPPRPLHITEALIVAEQQAQRLRHEIGATGPQLTNSQLHSIPGVIIESVANLTVSGATRKVGSVWIILTNRNEARVRQRFTICHEIKHILDDRAQRHIRRTHQHHSEPGWIAERVCDYFAASILMPRLWVKRAWTNGIQTEHDLAQIFNVSRLAIHIRLRQLGLTEQHQRCCPPSPDVVPLTMRVAT